MDVGLLLTTGLQLNPETGPPRLLYYSQEQTLSSDFSPILLALCFQLLPQLHKALLTMILLFHIMGSGAASLIEP